MPQTEHDLENRIPDSSGRVYARPEDRRDQLKNSSSIVTRKEGRKDNIFLPSRFANIMWNGIPFVEKFHDESVAAIAPFTYGL